MIVVVIFFISISALKMSIEAEFKKNYKNLKTAAEIITFFDDSIAKEDEVCEWYLGAEFLDELSHLMDLVKELRNFASQETDPEKQKLHRNRIKFFRTFRLYSFFETLSNNVTVSVPLRRLVSRLRGNVLEASKDAKTLFFISDLEVLNGKGKAGTPIHGLYETDELAHDFDYVKVTPKALDRMEVMCNKDDL